MKPKYKSMETINRDAIIVSAKKSLINWVNSIDREHPIEFRDPLTSDESTIYLIEELNTEEDFKEWLSENYTEIFEEVLLGWITDESLWPQQRTFELFNEWVLVSWQSMVVDLNPDVSLEYDE